MTYKTLEQTDTFINTSNVNNERYIQTPKEEFFNSFSHAIGALFSIYAIVMLSVRSMTPVQSATTVIYGSMMFISFQASACYHAMVNDTAKKVFRKIDHSAIYLMIAGTYTPLLMLVMKFPHSVAMMSMVWYLAITGIVFSCLSLKFKHLSTGLYLLLGWLSLFMIHPLWMHSPACVFYLLGGGILFTVGSIFYVREQKYMHFIWHLFVLAGAILHYLCIAALLPPMQ